MLVQEVREAEEVTRWKHLSADKSY